MLMPTSEDHELLKNARPAELLISGVDALCLLGSLQLALRHPKNNGPSSEVVREVARRLEEYIVSQVPAFKELCAAGWDPNYDVP